MFWIVVAAVGALGAMAAYVQKQMDKAKSAAAGLFVNKTALASALPIIYGKRRIGAKVAWKHTDRDIKSYTSSQFDSTYVIAGANSNSANTKQYMHRLDVWCLGEVDSIATFRIDGDQANASRFRSSDIPTWRFLSKYGSSTQTTPTSLSSAFTEISTDMHGKGIAYTWSTFFLHQDEPQYQGEPELTADIRGMKVWDPRVAPSNTAVKSWSDNPALCLLDYLMADYGKQLDVTMIDLDSFIAGANYAEETEVIPAPTTAPYTGYHNNPITGDREYYTIGDMMPWNRPDQVTNNIKRFGCNIVLNSDEPTKDNVEKLLKTMKAGLTYSQGVYKLIIERPESSVMSFNESNMLNNVSIGFGDRSKRFNRVSVKFPNANKEFVDDTVSWPERDSLVHLAYKQQDNGEDLHREIELEGVTDFYQASDICEYIVRESRNQQFIKIKAQPTAMQLEPGDVIDVTSDSLGLSAQKYRVRQMKVEGNLTVSIEAQMYDEAVYAWDQQTAEPAPVFQRTTAFDAPATPSNLSGTEVTVANNDLTNTHTIVATWDAIVTDNGTQVDTIFVEYKEENETIYSSVSLPQGTTQHVIVGIADNKTYDVRLRYRNTVGRYSDYATATVDLSANSLAISTVDQAARDAAAAAAVSAQNASDLADEAQAAADAAQSDADAAILAANNAQATADLGQTASEVATAIANDTTAIDGARITTGTVAGDTIIATSEVIVGSGFKTAGLSGAAASEYRIWSGGNTGADSSFSVDEDGNVNAQSITIANSEGIVQFSSVDGFSEAAREQILGNTNIIGASKTFTQGYQATNTFNANADKTFDIAYNFQLSGYFQHYSSAGSSAQAGVPTQVTFTIFCNGSNLGTDTYTRTTGTAGANQFRMVTGSGSNYNYANVPAQTVSGTRSIALTSGSHVVEVVISVTGGFIGQHDVGGVTWDQRDVPVTVSTQDGSNAIVTGNEVVTITQTIPTTVGSTDHGHVFYIYN